MATLLRASGQRLIVGPRQKPSGACIVDWSHPITQAMRDCLVWNEGVGAPANLATPVITALTSGPTWVPTVEGISGYATGGSSFDIPDHGSIGNADFAIHVIFLPVTWPASFTVLFDKSSGSNRDASLFFDTSGNVDFMSFGAGAGGSFSISTGFATGSVWDLLVTRAGSTVSFYANGKLVTTATQAGGTPDTGAMSFGNNPSTGGHTSDVKYIAAQTWTRALSAAEALSLFTDPYGFIIPAEGEMPALFVAAAASTFVPYQPQYQLAPTLAQ